MANATCEMNRIVQQDRIESINKGIEVAHWLFVRALGPIDMCGDGGPRGGAGGGDRFARCRRRGDILGSAAP